MRDGNDDNLPKTRALEPQLSEVLRTCIHPPTLLLRIINIVRHDVETTDSDLGPPADSKEAETTPSDTNNRYATKLLVSDGQLMVQALLHRKLNVLPEAADIRIGDLLEVRKFVVKKARRINGVGKVVYLGIEDCYFIKRPLEQSTADESLAALAMPTAISSPPRRRKRDLRTMEENDEKEHAGTSESSKPSCEGGKPSNKRQQLARVADIDDASIAERPTTVQYKRTHKSLASDPSSSQEEFDDFEVFTVDEQEANSRRNALRELNNNNTLGRSTLESQNGGITSGNGNPTKQVQKADAQADESVDLPQPTIEPFHPQPQPPVHAFQLSQQRYSAQIQHQLNDPPNTKHSMRQPHISTQPKSLPVPPLHTLASLRADTTLPAKNYAVTVLAYISWIGTTLIHRPGSPFPPKRHLKLTDASLTQSRPVSRNGGQPTPAATTHGQNGGSGPRSASCNATIVTSNATTPSAMIFTPQNSSQDAVTLAVFADATAFKPMPGTLALFCGIVTQRLGNGDVILNAYARIKEQRFLGRNGAVSDSGKAPGWFVDDPDVIKALGYEREAQALRLWWEERQPHR